MSRRGRRGGRGRGAGQAPVTMAALAKGELPDGGVRQQQLAMASADFLRSMSGWDGANQSTARGFVYWPGLDAKRELDSYTRRELMKKSRWLRANMGLPNRICGGLADLIGFLVPVWDSGDDDWDREVEEHWQERTESALAVDRSGTYGIQQLQVELDRAAFGDGDILPVVIEAEGSGGAQVMLYEAPQMASPERMSEKDGWYDGVKVDRFRRHVEYGLQEGGEARKVRRVAARDAIYYAHPDALGRIRPPTILARAINHLVDVAEILADWKLSIKVAAQMGIFMRRALPGTSGWGAEGVFSGLRNERVSPPSTDDTEDEEGGAPAADGSDDKDIKWEDVYTAGGGIANLPVGVDLGTLQDERPHPNAMALVQHLVRDIAWGVGTSPELLWDISGLRGANNRWANADLGRWLGCRMLRKRSWMKRYCSIWAAKEMKAGRIGEPAGGKFWKMGFIPQADLTADKGREGKLNMDLVHAKLRSLRTHYGEEGRYWLREVKQIARERETMREFGLVAAEVEAEGDGSARTHEDRGAS